MTFEQIITRANEANPNAQAHVFIEYADGKRGFMKSFDSREAALRFVNSAEGDRLAAQAYDRDGNDVE